MSDLHKADPKARRQALTLLALATAFGIAFISLIETFSPTVTAWVTAEPEHIQGRARLVLGLLTLTLIGPTWGVSLYLWQFGTDTIRARRFPPKNAVTIHTIKILREQPAVSRGRQIKTLSILLGIIGTVISIMLWRLTTLLVPS